MKQASSKPVLLKPLYRGLPVVILVVLVFVLIARRYLRYTTPMYESTAKIKLADAREGVPNGNLYKDFDVFASSTKIGTEVEVLKSEAMIEKVVNKLGSNIVIYRVGDIHKTELYDQSPLIIEAGSLGSTLYDKPFSLVIGNGSHMTVTMPGGAVINGMIGTPVTTPAGAFIVRLNESLLRERPKIQVNDRYEFIVYTRDKMVSNIIANLDVTSVDKDIPVLRVSYKSPVARKAADVVNAVAQTYILDYVEEKYRSADTTEGFLSSQLKEYSNKLSSSEQRIQQYRDNKDIINIHQETETDLRKIADLKKQLASVEMNLEAIDTLNGYIRNGRNNFTELAPNFEAFTDLLSTEIIKDMKRLQAEKKDLLLRYTPENEKVVVIDKKINDLSDYLQESIRNTQTNLRIKYNDLKQTIRSAEAEFIGLPEKERNMTVMERDFGLNEQIYRFLQEKRTDARIAKAATISFHRIISRGEVPAGPVSPNARLITVFAGFLGLLFSVIGIFGMHKLRARVDNETLISRNSDTPLAFSIPFCSNSSGKAAAFSRWALELELKQDLAEEMVIGISSNKAGEGKHFCATGLAEAAGRLGKKVLLVAMNGTREPQAALYDHATPQAEQAQWQIPRIWNALLNKWKLSYDLIILENTAITEAESMIALTAANRNFFLLDTNITKISEIETADELRDKLQLKHMQFVLNRAGYMPGLLTPFINLLKKLRRAEHE